MTLTFEEIAQAMLKCEQTQGQSVYQHGVSVKHYFDTLTHTLDISAPLPNWKIPSWLETYKDKILCNLHDREIISMYLLFHDSGKPFCREVDAGGKVHFPNHAQVSKTVFLDAGGNAVAANLIGWDMVLHSESSEEIQKRCEMEWTVQDACTLLLAALSEIHSNVKLFGNNVDSTSFKIKWKQIDRRGKQICNHYFKD